MKSVSKKQKPGQENQNYKKYPRTESTHQNYFKIIVKLKRATCLWIVALKKSLTMPMTSFSLIV